MALTQDDVRDQSLEIEFLLELVVPKYLIVADGAIDPPRGEIHVPVAHPRSIERDLQGFAGGLKLRGSIVDGLFERRSERADFILAPTRLDRRADGPDHCVSVERAFEEDYVPEVIEPHRRQRAPRGLVPIREDDEREVGPCRLAGDPLHKAAAVAGRESFLGDQRRSGSVLQLADERSQIAAGETVETVPPQEVGSDLGVTTPRGEDEYAEFHVRLRRRLVVRRRPVPSGRLRRRETWANR
ncbi:hypothetical protein PQ455_13300 [Sphingomonas naphthae]|uniref:Uncharacterized protein n=1 Tax=Sphingomonas naphthae TaxID=1813468 RepID=A0ABY7THH0_9SPHN|nr:hypothetical protein [Sphingomonas naphthae]WCT72604.1 hypothetical protein PQ455_13300 [Sphingomonas naphthae]